jgi:hypothetical protein
VDEHALILYVYLPSHDESSDESVLTVRISLFVPKARTNYVTVLYHLIYIVMTSLMCHKGWRLGGPELITLLYFKKEGAI